GGILALLILTGGIALDLTAVLAFNAGMTIAGRVFLAALSIPLVLGGLAGLRWVKATASLRVLICPAGFIEVKSGRAVGCCWGHITEMMVPMDIATVCRQGGRRFVFTPNRVARFGKLIQLMHRPWGCFWG